MEFVAFPKIPRLNRQVTVMEKIDGTNAQIFWLELNDEEAVATAKTDLDCQGIYPGLADGDSAMALYIGSRNKWISPKNDNYGFARWVMDHVEELRHLGPGKHFGEWWGLGIQRNYGVESKRFSLFNTHIWREGRRPRPTCCGVVPVLYEGIDRSASEVCLDTLRFAGSAAAPGFMNPEGIVVWHSATRGYTKATCQNDDQPKGKVEE